MKTPNPATPYSVAHRERCRQYMVSLVGGFLTYCQIPIPEVRYLRLDGETETFTEGNYPFADAMTFDDAGDCQLGMSIVLTTRGTEPWVSFGLFVSEKDEKVSAKLGADEAVPINLKNLSQCDEFYQSIVDRIKRSFTEPQKPGAEPIGFKRSELAANEEGQERNSRDLGQPY